MSANARTRSRRHSRRRTPLTRERVLCLLYTSDAADDNRLVELWVVGG